MTDEVKSDVEQDDLKETATEVSTEEVKEVDTTDGLTPPEGDGTTDPKSDATEQEETSAAIAFKLREEKRKRVAIEKENAQLKAQMSVTPVDKPVMPKQDSFENDDDFHKATAEYYDKLTDWKLDQHMRLTAAQKTQQDFYDENQKLADSYDKKVEKAVVKYPDYVELVEKTDFDNVIREAIFKAENSAEIAYYIAKNPDVGKKLLNSSAVDVAWEVKSLDMRLKKSLNQKTVSNAPDPIKPVDNAEMDVEVDWSKLSTDEWIKKDRERNLKKLKNKMETGML
jgi:hypothetical protein